VSAVPSLSRLWRRITDGWYYLRCLVWHRYNVVKAKHLPPTWVDRCQLLPHVMFQVLCDFVEKEDGIKANYFEGADKYTDAECDESGDPQAFDKRSMRRQTIFAIELNRLYEWWNTVYLPYYKDEEGYLTSRGIVETAYATYEEYIHAFGEEEDRMRDELTANLISLVRIRGDMCT